jgi:uncharacterized protein YndB with AHSA1/START domain
MAKSDTETVERTIAAPPEAIFALLSDANRHQEIDGGDSVKGAKGTPEPLSLGSKFGMSMRLGVPYTTVNTVIEFEPNRRIAWQTYPTGVLSKLFGGRIWRYELEPVDGGTTVRETWDISQERHKSAVEPLRSKTIEGMTGTLERIEKIVAGS